MPAFYPVPNQNALPGIQEALAVPSPQAQMTGGNLQAARGMRRPAPPVNVNSAAAATMYPNMMGGAPRGGMPAGPANMGNPALAGANGAMPVRGYAQGGMVQPQQAQPEFGAYPMQQAPVPQAGGNPGDIAANNIMNNPEQAMSYIQTAMPYILQASEQSIMVPTPPMDPKVVLAAVDEFIQSRPQQVQAIQQMYMALIQGGETTLEEIKTGEQMAIAALQNPQLYPQLRAYAIQQGLAGEDELAQQYNVMSLFVIILCARVTEMAVGGQGGQGVPPKPEQPIESFAEGGLVQGKGTIGKYADGGFVNGSADIIQGTDNTFNNYLNNLQAAKDRFSAAESTYNDLYGQYQDAYNNYQTAYNKYQDAYNWGQDFMKLANNMIQLSNNQGSVDWWSYLADQANDNISAIGKEATAAGDIASAAADRANAAANVATGYSNAYSDLFNTPIKTDAVSQYQIKPVDSLNYHTNPLDYRGNAISEVNRNNPGVTAQTGVFPGSQAATGGRVYGPGTSTSDSIPIMVSAGEYVIPADVVRAKGTDFFDKMIGKDKKGTK